MEGYIYKIINSLTNQVYIGQAINLKKRIYRYKVLDCVNQKLIYQSLKKYGWEAHRLEILEVADSKLLNNLETKYIKEHNTCWYNNPEYGLNILSIHSTRKGIPHSSETKNKLSICFKGRRLSDETKKKMSESRKGKMYNAVKVYQFTKEGEFVKEYPSITSAFENTKINITSIHRCINKKMHTAGGFKWSLTK